MHVCLLQSLCAEILLTINSALLCFTKVKRKIAKTFTELYYQLHKCYAVLNYVIYIP